MTRSILPVFFVFMVAAVQAQDLTGTWEGSGSGAPYWRIGILHIGDSCYGYSYDEGPGYCKVNFVASFDKQENRFKGRGISFIDKTFGHGLFTCNLHYSKEGATEYLRGGVRPKSVANQIFTFGIGMPGRLRKISNTVDSTVFMLATLNRLRNIPVVDAAVSDSLVAPLPENKAAATTEQTLFEDSVTQVKNSRNSVVVKTISTAADTVKIILYDDGEIDGDIVTVFDNGKIVVNQLTLTKQPYELLLVLPEHGSKHTIELMAENEGSIPPNTAYMLVLAGTDRVEVKASSDTLSNAAIVIQKSQ